MKLSSTLSRSTAAIALACMLASPSYSATPRVSYGPSSPAQPYPNHGYDEHHHDDDRGYSQNGGQKTKLVVHVNPPHPAPRAVYAKPAPIYVVQPLPVYRPAPIYYPAPPVAYYRAPAPRYYYSNYYTRRPIPVEPAQQYVEVRCGSDITGTIVGGVAGGLVANQFARGHHDRGLATVGGALLGAIVGHSVDRSNEHCAYQALEYGRPDTQVVWADPNADYSYTITPGAIQQQDDGRYCREYQAKVLVDGRMQDGYGRACREPDGSWEMVN